MNKSIENFLKEYIELIDENNYKELYKKTNSKLFADEVGRMTKFFLDLGINPLDYMNTIPNGYLEGQKLSSFDIPNHIKAIERFAFNTCVIPKIKIPDSVETIDEYAFSKCESMKSIELGTGLKVIKTDAFYHSYDFDKIYIKDIKQFCEIDGLYYLMSQGADTKRLYLNNRIIKNLDIPEGIYYLDSLAFSNCVDITSVIIPSTMRVIRGYTFDNCNSLKTVSYKGTKTHFRGINMGYPIFPKNIDVIHCTDGDLNI